jgi:hypothetical protein
LIERLADRSNPMIDQNLRGLFVARRLDGSCGAGIYSSWFGHFLGLFSQFLSHFTGKNLFGIGMFTHFDAVRYVDKRKWSRNTVQGRFFRLKWGLIESNLENSFQNARTMRYSFAD